MFHFRIQQLVRVVLVKFYKTERKTHSSPQRGWVVHSKIKYKGKSLQALNDKSSGNDFCETAYVEGIKVDILVNPNLSYEEITYKGFEYKVNNLYNILEAKLKYAKAGNEKHIIDIKTMLGIKEDANDSLINASSTWK